MSCDDRPAGGQPTIRSAVSADITASRPSGEPRGEVSARGRQDGAEKTDTCGGFG